MLCFVLLVPPQLKPYVSPTVRKVTSEDVAKALAQRQGGVEA